MSLGSSLSSRLAVVVARGRFLFDPLLQVFDMTTTQILAVAFSILIQHAAAAAVNTSSTISPTTETDCPETLVGWWYFVMACIALLLAAVIVYGSHAYFNRKAKKMGIILAAFVLACISEADATHVPNSTTSTTKSAKTCQRRVIMQGWIYFVFAVVAFLTSAAVVMVVNTYYQRRTPPKATPLGHWKATGQVAPASPKPTPLESTDRPLGSIIAGTPAGGAGHGYELVRPLPYNEPKEKKIEDEIDYRTCDSS